MGRPNTAKAVTLPTQSRYFRSMRWLRGTLAFGLAALGLGGLIHGVRDGQLTDVLVGTGMLILGVSLVARMLATRGTRDEPLPRSRTRWQLLTLTAAITSAGGIVIGWVAASGDATRDDDPATTSVTSCEKIAQAANNWSRDLGSQESTDSRLRRRVALRIIADNPACFSGDTVAVARAVLDETDG